MDKTTSEYSLGQAHKPLREAAADAIRDAIVGGRFKPGERLFEDKIANELEISRNPVREALHALATESFVTLEPRRGARVASIDRERARELFEVRAALEGLMGALAAERCTKEQATALEALVATGSEAASTQSLDALPALNTHFHELLADIADNALLTDLLRQLSGVIRWIYAERLSERVDGSWAEHRTIAAAVTAGDSAEARTLAEQHVSAARVAFLGS